MEFLFFRFSVFKNEFGVFIRFFDFENEFGVFYAETKKNFTRQKSFITEYIPPVLMLALLEQTLRRSRGTGGTQQNNSAGKHNKTRDKHNERVNKTREKDNEINNYFVIFFVVLSQIKCTRINL